MVPDNIIKTLLSSVVTTHVREPTFGAVDVNDTDVIYHRQVGSSNGPNILGVLTSSLVLGLVAGSRLEKTQPLIALAEAVTEVMTVLVGIIIQLLPLAMISLIASALATVDSLENGVIALSLLVACSLCFSLILSIVVFPLIHAMFVRRNLFAVYKAMYRPLITAFCTTSSLVTLPDLFKVCDQLGVEPYIVRTLAPFLTSFNANGSSAFIASAVCFIAQVTGFPLNVAQMIGIGFTHSSCRFHCFLSLISLHPPPLPSFLAGFNVMALPAVPSASIITVFLIIRVFQIPEQAVSLLFIVEFINDRLRTVTNVMSHANCIMTVHYLTVRHRNSNKLDPIVVQFAFHKDLQGSTTMSQQVSGDSVTQNSLADSEEKIDQPFCVTIS
ncbi:Excitatory amino acid transporter 3 [Fasciola hepatica]|uniref:Amino acid transporter n=1 Tax=Fasciola hepatica TaxID=6192 RepID=A0A4E0RY03_FASHE|nr:Excitatory amino acid transporter 3 [Fasciola hepatica]